MQQEPQTEPGAEATGTSFSCFVMMAPRLRLGFGLTFDIPLAYALHAASREILRSHVRIRKALSRLIEFLTQADGIITLKENGRAVSLPNDLVGKAVTVRLDPAKAPLRFN